MARSRPSRAARTEEVEYAKQSWNIYSMMLLLSLLAVIIGCIFLCLELSAYDWNYAAKGVATSALDPAAARDSAFSQSAAPQHFAAAVESVA